MACDLSLNDAPVVTHPGYIPRNAIDHMNPYFFKSHQHAHSHQAHGHHHSHHQSRQQNYTTHPYPHPPVHSLDRIHVSQSSSSTSSNSSTSTSTLSSPSVGLQTPVPKQSFSHLEHVNAPSYNTPPATPPLAFSEREAAIKATANTNKNGSTTASTTEAAKAKKDTIAGAAETNQNKVNENDPLAWCTARARIPTPDGSEYFLHIYENKKDKKEHLAFVFGDAIRSQSLDKVQPNETETDRIMRGAYTGRLKNIVDLGDQQQDLDTTTITSATATTTTTTTAITTTTFTTSTSTTTATTTTTAAYDEDVIMEQTINASPIQQTSATDAIPLVRIHSECFTGEVGHSARCDCGEQLDEAIRLMKEEGSGVVVYLRQEGRGIGLGEKLKAYNLQDLGYDTVMANLLLNHGADERTYDIAQAILQDLGLARIRLLTNNPDKMEKIERGENSNIKVVDRVPMMPKSWEAIQQGTESEFVVKEGAVENKIVKGKELDRYLKVKVERMRHLINIPTSL
ncbi:GTP cyclohydrolase II [Entomortierella beljakovae]|nr:GTP cyclohydrolase II [Entomortierella beljakovae]